MTFRLSVDTHTVVIVGLGYVGLPLAVEFGKIRPVVGYDISRVRIEELKCGYDKTFEISSEEIVAAKFLTYTSNLSEVADRLTDTGAVFIVTVPTPVDDSNVPDFSHLISATEMVGGLLRKGDFVVYESTVYPGATEEVCVPLLESVSGLRLVVDDQAFDDGGFHCGYSPERINPGDKSRTLTSIQKVVSGSTDRALDVIDELYASIIEAGTHRASSIKVAEAAKVIENCQRDINIAFVNELSLIFNRLGIDTQNVLNAAKTKWNFLDFQPGLVGGHCIGVDPYYLTHKATAIGYHPEVILAGRRINDGMAKHVADNFVKLLCQEGVSIKTGKVGILGLTFKENCKDLRNSKVFDVIKELRTWGIDIEVFDPHVPRSEFTSYGDFLLRDDFFDDGSLDGLIVAVRHDEFTHLSASRLRGMCKVGRPLIADLKSLYRSEDLANCGFKIFKL